VVGFAGRLVNAKGLQDLFLALENLVGDWSLLVVGDGELRPELEAQAQANKWRARFVGYVGIDDMPQYFSAMDCLVLPSRTMPDWKEQFGLVLAQAMACRVPVIGSSSGAIPEVIEDAGLIFPERDVEALRHCLQKLMDDEPYRQGLAQKGYERALAKYSATGLADETYLLFQKLLANRIEKLV